MVQWPVAGCDGRLQGMTSEYDYMQTSPTLRQSHPNKDAAISYIEGCVVRMMKRRITCIQALTTTETGHAFVALKDRGFLQKPSSSDVTVCEETEKCSQRLLKASGRKLPQHAEISASISTAVLSNTADKSLFPELHNHMCDTSIDDNHILALVKMASSCYSKIKLFHPGKRVTESLIGTRVRKQLSKLINERAKLEPSVRVVYPRL